MSTRIWYLFSFNEVSMPSYRAAKVPNINCAEMASIEQTEAGDNKRGLKIIPAQPRSGVCNHAHTAVGHGPAGRRLHITHTATGYYTATVCRDYTLPPAIEAVHNAGYCVTAYSHCMQCGWAGLGWALQLHIKYQILQRHSKHFSCVSDETRARGHQQ